jgi:hypothetical protein
MLYDFYKIIPMALLTFVGLAVCFAALAAILMHEAQEANTILSGIKSLC